MTKQEIKAAVEAAYENNLKIADGLTDSCELTDYASLTYEKDGFTVWTKALQTALNEHEAVVIPPSDIPYGIDGTVAIPSGRKITAYGAEILQLPEVRVLMLRNEHTQNGTHAPIPGTDRDSDIAVMGGIWSESWTRRLGYGRTGKYDEEYTWKGVSTLFYFGNADRVTVKDVTFRHTAGFSLQCGDVNDIMFDNIVFDECFADGLHINGNTHCVLCRNIRGQVGDDLVALNMYDWQNSSVNFGPMSLVYCEDMFMSDTSPYKAMRIEPGTYWYDDGSSVDCSLTDAYILRSGGVITYKMYYQTPGYKIGTPPERGAVGSGDNIYFEDIDIDLCQPNDGFREYLEADPVRGAFGAFELGANIGTLSLENIRIKMYKDRFPNSYLLVCGPKSCIGGNGDYEVFDPYLSSRTGRLILRDIFVNGEKSRDVKALVYETKFDDINKDGHSTASGVIEEIVI